MNDSVKVIHLKEGVAFDVKVLPRSSKNEIAGIVEGKIKVKLSDPPVDGRANSALIDFLALNLDIKRNRIEILKGETSSIKRLFIRGDDKSIELKLNKIGLFSKY